MTDTPMEREAPCSRCGSDWHYTDEHDYKPPSSQKPVTKPVEGDVRELGAGHEDGPDCAKHGLHYHLQGGGIKWPQPHACPSCGTWHVYRAQPASDVAGLPDGIEHEFVETVAKLPGIAEVEFTGTTYSYTVKVAGDKYEAIERIEAALTPLYRGRPGIGVPRYPRFDYDIEEVAARSTEEDRT